MRHKKQAIEGKKMMMKLTAKSKNGEDHGYPTTTHRFKPNNRFLPLEETIEH